VHEYRPDIDGLRAIAVVTVVLFHARIPGFTGGFVGVDVFFVISGFLITRLLRGDIERGYLDIVRFYERRARRILPALLVVIATSTGAGYLMLMPTQFAQFAQSGTAAALFGANFWFWNAATGYFSPTAELMPLLHTWSLGVEEQFYVLYPLLLWLLSRWGRRAIAVVLATLTLISLAASEVAVQISPDAAFYFSPMRAWEIGIGALLALSAPSRPLGQSPWLLELAAAAGLASIFIAATIYTERTPFPGYAALLPCLGAAAVIQAGTLGNTLVTRALACRPLYLWHWPILAFLRVRLGQVDIPVKTAAIALAGAFALAALSWAFIERPARKRSPRDPSSAAVLGLFGVATAAILVVLTVIHRSDGFPSRIRPDIRMAQAAARDTNPAREQCFNKWPEDGFCRFGSANSETAQPDLILWGD